MSIGQRLNEYLDKFRITQDQIASKSGVSRQTINNAINGKNAPSGEVLSKILLSFPQMDPCYLMTGKKSTQKYGIIDTPMPKVSEPGQAYNKLLEAKDAEISALKQLIEAQKELISALKK